MIALAVVAMAMLLSPPPVQARSSSCCCPADACSCGHDHQAEEGCGTGMLDGCGLKAPAPATLGTGGEGPQAVLAPRAYRLDPEPRALYRSPDGHEEPDSPACRPEVPPPRPS